MYGKYCKSGGRLYYLDIMRIVACAMVVMIHCSADYTYDSVGSVNFTIGFIFDMLSRPAVPIFVAVSGMLFLNEEKRLDIKTMLKKYVLSIAVLYVVWAIIYALFDGVLMPVMNGKSVVVTYVARLALTGTSYMWFLLMLIGLYLITPVLRLFVKRENKQVIEYFLIIIFVFTFLMPYLIATTSELINSDNKLFVKLSEQLDKFNMSFVGGYLFYFLFGWYVGNIGFSKRAGKTVIWLGIGAIAFAITSTLALSIIKGKPMLWANLHNLYAPVSIYTAGIITFIVNKFKNVEFKQNGIVCGLSRLTFGVYMVHIAIWKLLIHYGLFSRMAVLDIPLMFIALTVSSFAISYIMSKIPFVKKLIKA